MSTLNAGTRTTVTMDVGSVLTVAAGVGSGHVTRLANPVGGEPYSPVAYSGSALTFGPYDDVTLFRLSCSAGALAFDVAPTLISYARPYRATIASNQHSNVYVPPGSALTISGAGATGRIVQFSTSVGGEPFSPILFTGSDITIVATNALRIFRVSAQSGVISVATAYYTGAVAFTQRSVAPDSNTLYIMAPSGWGTAIAWKFIKGNGGASGTDLGGNSPMRLSGYAEFASIASDPTGSALTIWSDDPGAQSIALKSTAGKFGNDYHGLGTGTSVLTLFADGVSVDPTQPQVANSFVFQTVNTPVWPTGETATITSSVTVNTGYVDKSGRLVSASNFPEYYGNMNIGSGNFDEVFVGASVGSLLGFKADLDASYLPGYSVVRMRQSATGLTITETSDAPSKSGFSRDEVRPSATIGTRLKTYYRFTAVPGDIKITSRTEIGKGASGATTFPANLITNGTFDTDITGWVETTGGGGSSPVVAGKVQQTSNVGNQIKLTQLRPGLDTAAPYIFRYDLGLAGTAPNVGNVIGVLGVGTTGGTGGAITGPIQSAGKGAFIFVPTQAQLQVILGQQVSTTGQTITTWDNIELRKLG